MEIQEVILESKTTKRRYERDAPNVGKRGSVSYGYMTQEEVAEVMGISRVRVSQLERSAMSKIRDFLTKDNVDLND